MIRSFLRNSLIYGGASVATRGINIFLVPVYTRVLAPADYGVIDIVTVFAAVVASVIPLEIVQAIARFLPDQASEVEKKVFASTSLWFVAASFGIFVVVTWLFADAIAAALIGFNGNVWVVRVAALAMIGSGVFYVIQSQLHWRLRPREYALTGIVYSISSILSSVVLVVGLRTGVLGVFLGQAIGAVIGVGVAIGFTASYFGMIFDARKLRQMLRFSTPLVPSTLGLIAALYVDRLAINALMSLAAVGIFGVGYRVASIVQLLLIGSQTAITPLVYASHRNDAMRADLARIFRTFAAVALTLWLSLGLFAREVVRLFTTPEYYAAASVVPLLVPAITLAGAYVFMPGLAIGKRTSHIAVINIAAGALNLLLNLMLIPVLGIHGAATATLASSAASFGVNAMASQRTYPVPHDWTRLGSAVAAVSVLVAASWLLIPLTASGFAVKLGMLALGVGAVVGLGLIRLEEIRRGASRLLTRIGAA